MPAKLTAADRMKFAKAKALSRRHDIPGVIKVMEELSVSYPDNAKIRAILANAYWDSADVSSSEREFRKAVELAPTLQIASLGLFHCLWDLNRRDEALAEMKRFMALADSEDYKAILEELIRTP